MEVYNENFFKDLSNYYMEWELLEDGKVVRAGRVDQLNVEPQQRTRLTLNIGKYDADKECLLNVSYKLKETEGILPVNQTIARDQLRLSAPKLSSELLQAERFASAPEVTDNQQNYLIVKGDEFRMEFNKKTGFLTKYEFQNKNYLQEGSCLKPNFWRAPTDNDFGCKLQQKYSVWKNPSMKLIKMEQKKEDGNICIHTEYDMKQVSGKLCIDYTINNAGELKVHQKLTANKDAKIPNMFRFGMRMQMPEGFERVTYYGRGPVENYSDRHSNTFLGIYDQTVDEQYYPYIRPQETGNKTDIRWWNVTNICIDRVQSGLACIDSWSALPLPQYRVPYQDYEFTFAIIPVKNKISSMP